MPINVERVVEEKLKGRSKCAGHCQESTELKLLTQKGMVIGCYRCASGYVSLLVQYGRKLDLNAFKDFLISLSQPDLTDEDIRVATRYNWDLNLGAEPEGIVLREAYWRQSYRRTKSDNPNRMALFMCTKCSSFYRQQLSDKNTLCARCALS